MSDSTTKSSSSSGGVGALALLGIAFVVLKLCHVIDWSWWWVTCPFWGPLVLVVSIFMVMVGGALLWKLARTVFPKRKRGNG